MASTRQERVEWLRRITSESGIPPTRLAGLIGVSPSTLTRPLNEPDYKSTLSLDTIAKIVAYTGLPGPDGYVPPIAGPGFAEPELRRFEREPDQSGLRVRRNAQDIWEVRSAHMELEGLLIGDHILVDMNETPRGGDIVIAQVYSDTSGSAETILRRYEPPHLVTASTQRRPPRPLLVDNERVVIRGVVTESWRHRGAA